ncbi:MAG: kelch repeat-containing protein [Crocinitomicaceae bacterium]|nr:kelch repeat-containing protein [Crocinitomicaceae bacterium]
MKVSAIVLFLTISISSFGNGWIQKSDFGGEARHRTTALAIGNSIYFGLGHYNGGGPNILFDDWWEYNPATNAWTQKANYMGGPTYHAAGFTIGGIGYVGTGRIPSAALVQTFYGYDPATNSWAQKANFPGSGRRGGVGFAIDGMGYLGTGSYTSDFYQYNPGLDSWTPVAPIPTGGRISGVGFELGGYGYVGTGSVSGATNDFWRFDPGTNSWAMMAAVGPTPRQEASGFALSGKGYILTGDDFSSGNNFGDMWEYDPALDTWVQLEDFPGTARRYLTCVTLGNYAYAGLGTNGTNFKDFWLYDPFLSLLEQNLDNLSINAFPNPTTDVVTFKFEGLENVQLHDLKLSITTLSGQVVISEELNNSELQLSTVDMRKGAYLYSVSYQDKPLKSGRLIVN